MFFFFCSFHPNYFLFFTFLLFFSCCCFFFFLFTKSLLLQERFNSTRMNRISTVGKLIQNQILRKKNLSILINIGWSCFLNKTNLFNHIFFHFLNVRVVQLFFISNFSLTIVNFFFNDLKKLLLEFQEIACSIHRKMKIFKDSSNNSHNLFCCCFIATIHFNNVFFQLPHLQKEQ